MTDSRHVLTFKEFWNAQMTTRSAFELHGPPPSRVCPPRPAVIQRPLFFSVYRVCTASFSAWSEGSGWKRPPQTSHRVDSVALPQARQHPLRRVTDLETLDPRFWSLTLVGVTAFQAQSLVCSPPFLANQFKLPHCTPHHRASTSYKKKEGERELFGILN